eukprot:11658470-Karenia_brevis.AAC.1
MAARRRAISKPAGDSPVSLDGLLGLRLAALLLPSPGDGSSSMGATSEYRFGLVDDDAAVP